MAVPQHGTTSLPALARHHGVLLPHSSKELTRALASPSVTRDLSASRGLESDIDAETMQVTSENQQLGGAPAVALVRDDDGHHVELVHHARLSILVPPQLATVSRRMKNPTHRLGKDKNLQSAQKVIEI